MVVLKALILANFYFGGTWCVERMDFEQFSLWKGVVVLKVLIKDNFYFVRVWWS